MSAGPDSAASADKLVFSATTVTTDNLSTIYEAWVPYRQLRSAKLRRHGLAILDRARTVIGPTYTGNAGQWYLVRAKNLARDPVEIMRDCGLGHITLVHVGSGELINVERRCNLPTCQRCATKAAAKRRNRIIQRLESITAFQKQAGHKPCLLTVTVRHSGDPAADAWALRRAWTLFRARWHKRHGYAMWFMRFEEFTPGTAGDGHVHWHCVAWLPYFDWANDLHPLWQESIRAARHEQGRACGVGGNESGGTINVQIRKREQDAAVITRYADKLQSSGAASAAGCAGYAGKSKIVLQADGPGSAEAIAAYLDSRHGMRMFQTSQGLLARALGPSPWIRLELGRDLGLFSEIIAESDETEHLDPPPLPTS